MASWRRSTHCAHSSCVEVATLPDGSVLMRDTAGVVLSHSRDVWSQFLIAAKRGDFRSR
ncbi:DUF397 domain-containing protein [Cryptosporangium sp. NPDC048952]|uniref:DUF397 domain-containing protein n=1 Tax=Cryptosporangium sp. NPDC048952 TaxID=3363961 RepID=UPI00371EFC54